MKTNLQTFPRWRRKYYRINPTEKALVMFRDDVMDWGDNFEKKQREIWNNPEEWYDNNKAQIYKEYDIDDNDIPCFEDIIQFYIKKEILGVSK